jgi:hypothetical protein
LIGLAHSLGWSPTEFWSRSYWELTAVVARAIEDSVPLPQQIPDEDLFSMLMTIAEPEPAAHA